MAQSRSTNKFGGGKRWFLTFSIVVFGVTLVFGFVRYRARIQLQDRLPTIPELADQSELLRKELVSRYSRIGLLGDLESGLQEVAMLYHANRYFAEALQVYEILEERGPENAKIVYLTSDIYQSVSDIEAFRNALERSLELGLEYGPVLVSLGRIALKEGDFLKAESLLKRALEADPKSIVIFDSLLALYSRTGAENNRKIIETHRNRLPPESIGQVDPLLEPVFDFCYDPSQLLVRADICIKRRDFEKGAFFLDRAIAIDEGDWKAYALQLILEKERGDLEAAIAAGFAAIEKGADVGIGMSQIVTMLIDKGEVERAENLLMEVIEDYADKPQLYVNLATVQKDRGQFAAAYKSLLKAEALLPASAEISNSKGELLWDMERKDEAAVCFERGISLSPFEGKPYMYLAQYYIENVQFSKAEEYVVEAIELEPENKVLYSMAADYFEIYGSQELEKGNFSNAIRLLQSARELSPTNLRIMQKLADANFKGGRYDDGKALLDSLVDSGKANPEVYMALGELASGNEDFEQAKQYFSEAVTRGEGLNGYDGLVAVAKAAIDRINQKTSE